MGRDWRLLIDGPLTGVENMSRDRAIQIAVDEGWALPTVRVYRWQRPTVTLGRFQHVAGVDASACDHHGVDVVRRFTGGRGVLHDDEVTYAVIAGIQDGVPRGVAASYRLLCSALVEAYRILGVSADLTTRDSGDVSSAACYLQTTRADLSCGARKLSGSAQVWTGSTVLQHGSFTITRDVEREAAVFSLDTGQAAHLAAATGELLEMLGRRPDVASIEEAIAEGFSSIARGRLVHGSLSDAELALASTLGQDLTVDVRP